MNEHRAYYNEHDPYAAQWLRNLIAAGHIADGDVDERSIEDVRPCELRGYSEWHLFAGIGVWSHALRIAGWPTGRPVLTCSCPCQPFSAAGKGTGFDDQRHLWPAAFHIIRQLGAPVVFGEQVASKDAEPWIDLVQADMEGVDHAFGCVPFPSAGIGAPHIRDRAYWMAYADNAGLQGRTRAIECSAERAARSRGLAGGMVNTDSAGRIARKRNDTTAGYGPAADATCGVGWLADSNRQQQRGLGGSEGTQARGPQNEIWIDDGQRHGHFHDRSGAAECAAGPANGLWRNADWLFCRDGKWRPVEPGTFPLVDGSAFRVGSGSTYEGKSRAGMLKGYGNAINAQAAAEFIRAYLDTEGGMRLVA